MADQAPFFYNKTINLKDLEKTAQKRKKYGGGKADNSKKEHSGASSDMQSKLIGPYRSPTPDFQASKTKI